MTKPRINITLDKEVLDKLTQEAKKEDRSRSYFINRALRKIFGLDSPKPKKKKE